MVVGDLHVESVTCTPTKADPPLIVDPDAVLANPIPAELLQSIARRYAKVLECLGCIE